MIQKIVIVIVRMMGIAIIIRKTVEIAISKLELFKIYYYYYC